MLLVALSPLGCERPALEQLCPELAPGDLVVSELRGKQAGPDSYGQWVELYNASSTHVSLSGITLRLRRLDGSGEKKVLVRSRQLGVEPGGYVVLGRFPPQEPPSHVDYGYSDDFSGDLYGDGILEIWSCQQLVDAVTYRSLPTVGTLAYDGKLIPDAQGNDALQSWCPDQLAGQGGDGGAQNLGVPGTPGQENRPCD